MDLPDLADDEEAWDDIYTQIARELLNNEDLNTASVYKKTAKQLIAAMNKGFGETSFDDENSRKSLQKKFIKNIEQFSYAKTLTQFKLFKDAMFNDKGQIQSFAAVKKLVADTGEVFNNNYLRAEHQFVTQTAIMANKWETLNSEYLEFSTVGDSHVRLEHKLFNKFTALKTDPIWKRLYTPLDWGCRCTIIPGIAKNVSKEYDSKWANTMVDPLVKGTIFDNNSAITGVIFNENHPYFKSEKSNLTTKTVETLHIEKDAKILNDNKFYKIEKEESITNQITNVYKQLSVDESSSVYMYTNPQGYYGHINTYNRTGKIRLGAKSMGMDDQFMKTITKTINEGLDKIPDRHTGFVYRGTNLKREDLAVYEDAFRTGKNHTEKSFMSTTMVEGNEFNGACSFKIKAKNGAIVEKISRCPHEKEVLFKAGQQFKVTKFENTYNDVYEIHMEEL